MMDEKLVKEVRELYKCHYTTYEVVDATGMAYSAVCELFRNFKYNNIKKYNKLNLSEWKEFTHARKLAVNE